MLSEPRQQPRLGRMVRQEELDLAEAVALPPAEPDEERHGPGGGRETGRLRVEADERDVWRRESGQVGEPIAVERQHDGRGLAADDRTGRVEQQLAVDGGGEPPPELDRAAADAAVAAVARLATVRSERCPVIGESPLERGAAHAGGRDGGSARPLLSWARSRRASARASISGSSRGPVHAGHPLSQPQPRIDPWPRRSALRGAPRVAD